MLVKVSKIWMIYKQDADDGPEIWTCPVFVHLLYTVNVWNPNVQILALSKVIPFPNGSDFRCLVYGLEPNQTFGFRTIH